MLAETQARLIVAIENTQQLLNAFDDSEPIDLTEYLIELLEGKADQLRGKLMPRKVKQVALPDDTATMMSRWYTLQAQLAEIKNEENQLRQAIVTKLFTAEKLEGTETIDIGNGWRLKATKELNVTATNASGQAMNLLNAIGAINPDLANGLVKWQPEIAMKPYRELVTLTKTHPELSVPLSACITVKPGMPKLEVVPPDAPVVVETGVVDEGKTFTDGSNVTF